ncbi:MAG: extensin family protein [Deltaproteobacteria bacterium]|nr:extensin family protein [Deltaproteobacteria bacterium]
MRAHLVFLSVILAASVVVADPPPARPIVALPRIATQAQLDRWIRPWPNMRMGHPREEWVSDPAATGPMRPREECLAELRAAGVEATAADPSPIVPGAVTVRSAIGGVRFVPGHGEPLTYACELVSRLVRFAAVLREQGIGRVTIASGYRDHPRVSFHTLGLAVDVSRFFRDDGSDLLVLRDYDRTPEAGTCLAELRGEKAQALQRLACALHERRIFSSVLTPNYNVGHHDHMHLDWRPADERFYLR